MAEPELDDWILRATAARGIERRELVQRLWSDYGRIERVWLRDAQVDNAIVKVVDPSGGGRDHPRGWATDHSHARKVNSYRVEHQFYRHFAADSRARLPRLIAAHEAGEATWLLMEDLDAAGFAGRDAHPNEETIRSCLRWLAHFHGSFLGREPSGLWPIGTYWHLATRPDEWASIEDERLRRAAGPIDALLNACEIQALVHGDAKIANFCIAADHGVAAVDFQYVGGGVGLKDVAYFLGSCSGASDAADTWLDVYFDELRDVLGSEAARVEAAWRPLFDHCWADFHRFLVGWAPGHWKLDGYGVLATERVLRGLE